MLSRRPPLQRIYTRRCTVRGAQSATYFPEDALRTMRRNYVAFTAILALGPTTIFPQDVTPSRMSIREGPGCARCDIVLEKVVTLGSATDTVSPSVVAGVVRDRAGRYYAASDPAIHILQYDARGRLERAIGRRGPGPGEYRNIVQLHQDSRGHLYVFDLGQRLTILDTGLRVVRAVGHPVEYNPFVVLPSGAVVMASTVSSADRVGFAIHVYGPGGEPVRSFDQAAGVFRANADPRLHRRTIGLARSGGIWSAPLWRYEIEEWDTAGRHLRGFRRDADWFRPPDPGSGRPQPQIDAIHEDDVGRLWVLMTVTNRRLPPPQRGQPPRSWAERARDYDTIIEVLDLSRRVVVNSRRLEGMYRGFVIGGHLYRVVEDPSGNQMLELFSVRLTPSAGGKTR